MYAAAAHSPYAFHTPSVDVRNVRRTRPAAPNPGGTTEWDIIILLWYRRVENESV